MEWSPNPAQLNVAFGDGGCLSRSPRCPTRHTQGACPVLLLRLQRLAHSLLVSPRQVHLSSPQPCQFISRCCPVPRGRRGRETSGPNRRWLAEPCPHLLFLRQACCSGACQRAGKNGEDVLCSRGIGVSPVALTSAGWDGERGPTMGQRAGAVHHQAQAQRSTRRGHWLFACDPQAWGKGINFIKYIKNQNSSPSAQLLEGHL